MGNENKKINLLMVDDEEEFLNSLSERLETRDFTVTTATQGEGAIEAAKKGGFDVAILDLNMPGMDGMELLKILKENHKFLEVIILTGFGKVESYKEATKLGAFSYLEKPFDMDQLLEELKNAYHTRLKKKFEHDKKRQEELDVLAMGSSPLAILKSLMDMDDDEK
ncbi:MAG: response regulator [Desulfobacterales bacterium]|nr:response regulator [Desulfobacterales bacterium]